MILFLDLEDTIIKPMNSASYHVEFLEDNIRKIKSVISEKIDDPRDVTIQIFSYAIMNDFQRDAFLELNKSLIEQRFGFELTKCFTVSGILKEIYQIWDEEVRNTYELSNVASKQQVFSILLDNSDSRESDVYYFDDIVKDDEYVNSFGSTIKIINIERI